MHSHAIQPFSAMHYRVAGAMSGTMSPNVGYGAFGANWEAKCAEAQKAVQQHKGAGKTKSGQWKHKLRVQKWERKAAKACTAAAEAKKLLDAGVPPDQVDAQLEAKYSEGPSPLLIVGLAGAGVLLLGGLVMAVKRRRKGKR